MAQREGIVNVNTIPSPQVEPMSVMPVEEEEQAPKTIEMEIDSHDSAHRHETVDLGSLQKPARAEVAHKTNGDARE
jgi:hypothetical protein